MIRGFSTFCLDRLQPFCASHLVRSTGGPTGKVFARPTGRKRICDFDGRHQFTKARPEGERFNLSVIAPYPSGGVDFTGATRDGYVASVKHAGQGRAASVELAFYQINLPHGISGVSVGAFCASSRMHVAPQDRRSQTLYEARSWVP